MGGAVAACGVAHSRNTVEAEGSSAEKIGCMTAANGVVVLVAATFGSSEVHRLPAAGAEDKNGNDGGMREGICIILSVQVQVAAVARTGDVWGCVPTTVGLGARRWCL